MTKENHNMFHVPLKEIPIGKEFRSLVLDKIKLIAKAKWSESDKWNPRITPEEAKFLLTYINKLEKE